MIKGLRQVQTNNPVILLDEIDRVADDALNTIMVSRVAGSGMNWSFTDHYLDYPFDLSKVLFVATANNTNRLQQRYWIELNQLACRLIQIKRR